MNRLFFNTLKFTSRAARTDKRCVANVRLVLYVMIERKIIVHLAKKEQIKYRKEIKIHKNSHMSVYSNICQNKTKTKQCDCFFYSKLNLTRKLLNFTIEIQKSTTALILLTMLCKCADGQLYIYHHLRFISQIHHSILDHMLSKIKFKGFVTIFQ